MKNETFDDVQYKQNHIINQELAAVCTDSKQFFFKCYVDTKSLTKPCLSSNCMSQTYLKSVIKMLLKICTTTFL